MDCEAMRRKVATVQSMHRKAAEMADAAKCQSLAANAEGSALRDLILSGESTGDPWLDMSIRLDVSDLAGKYGKTLKDFYNACAEHPNELVLITCMEHRNTGFTGSAGKSSYTWRLTMTLGITQIGSVVWDYDTGYPMLPFARISEFLETDPAFAHLGSFMRPRMSTWLQSAMWQLLDKEILPDHDGFDNLKQMFPSQLHYYVRTFVGDDVIDELFSNTSMDLYRPTYEALRMQLDYDPARLFH